MLIKIVGAVIILFSGSSLGWIIANGYLMRVKLLREFQTAITIFDTEISYNQSLLPDALEIVASSLSSPLAFLFRKTAQKQKELVGRTFAQNWQEELNAFPAKNILTAEDLQILIDWGKQIGRSSLAEQSKINNLSLKRLSRAEEQAREVVESKVRLARYAGVLLSLMVIILFY